MTLPQFIDISSFQPTVDWPTYVTWAKQWDGKARVSLRASQGTGVPDDTYKSKLSDARSSGVDTVIHYHYAYPNLNDPISEANYFASVVGTIPLDDILMLDYEQAVPEATADWAFQFGTHLHSIYPNIELTLYASLDYILNRLQDARLPNVFSLTLARWTHDPTTLPPCPLPWTRFNYWQFTDQANVPGLPSPVDANIWNRGTKMTEIPVVFNATPWSQFPEGPWDCGPASVATAAWARKPTDNTPNDTSGQKPWMVNEYNNKLSSGNGSSIEDMHKYLRDTQNGSTPILLHFWDYTNLTHDNIKLALQRGYPTIVTVVESSLFDLDCQCAVCQFNGNHILVIAGLDPQENYLCFDTCEATQPWPRRYDSSKFVFNGWATIIQLPWLPPIPNGDPSTWGSITTGPILSGEPLAAFTAIWNSIVPGVPMDTGIAEYMMSRFAQGGWSNIPGAPTGPEKQYTNGRKFQNFQTALVIWDGSAHLFKYL